MSQISVNDLTFCYEGSYDNIFEKVSFQIDTDWKLGFVGRNGRGKTTFLNLLLGQYEYHGIINTNVSFDYFPYPIPEGNKDLDTINIIEKFYPEYELWKVCSEFSLMNTDAEVLYRPFLTLSSGEQTKVMLAVLFSKDHNFLLIDEPTNHLDIPTRDTLKEYLKRKKGFILVSHDRYFLDACIDHVLVINKTDIRVEQGNFSSWWENKKRQDEYEQSENERLKKDIIRLADSARQSSEWANHAEASKIGFDPRKVEKNISRRSYMAEKSRRMQQRRKNLENRQQNEIEEKKILLKNVEVVEELKVIPLIYHKDVLIRARDFAIYYEDRKITRNLDFTVDNGDRIALQGKNGCGKSSIIKKILGENITTSGLIEIASGLKISYVSQDTSHLKGSLKDFIKENSLDPTLLRAILRKLDFERLQFEKNMEDFSGGQKKKVLIAKSLSEQAHLYIWDEPLNYIDVFSRMQIEQLIKQFKPTMMFVEHDQYFIDNIATEIVII